MKRTRASSQRLLRSQQSRVHQLPSSVLLISIVVTLLLFIVFVFRVLLINTTKTHAVGLPIVIDHTSVELFDQIPDQYIQAAAAMRMLFIDRSVGFNIHDGLNCIATGTPFASAPTSCKSSLTEATYVSDTKYNRSNWNVAHYGEGGWYDNVRNVILNQNLQDASRAPWAPDYSSYDVINFMFSYLDVQQTSSIMNIATPNSGGYFVPSPGNPNAIADVHDMEAFEATYPGKTFIISTTSLARSVGTQISDDFNARMRDYASIHNRVLFDMADIESHDLSGNPCYDNLNDGVNHEAICTIYTSEANGGHLSYGLGKQRIAKAFWVMMAQLAGWNPGVVPSPTQVVTSTITPTTEPSMSPTSTLTPTPSSAPTATPTPLPATPTPTNGPLDPSYYLNFDNEGTLGGDCTTCAFFNTTLVMDEYHNAFDFNGTSSYMNLGNIAQIKSWPVFTFSVWIKPAFGPTESVNRYVFAHGSEMSLFYLSAINDWRAYVRTPAGNIRVDTQSLSWTTNTWHMVTVVYNGTTAKIYWDGVLKGSTAGNGSVSTSTQTARVGAASVLGSYFKGLIDELSIYPTALSQEEIDALYNLGR